MTGGPGGAQEAARYLAARGRTAQVIVLPELTHFQAYSHTGFEIGSALASEWFLKYLAAAPGKPSSEPPALRHEGNNARCTVCF